MIVDSSPTMVFKTIVEVPRLRHDGGAKTGSRLKSGAAPATVSGERWFQFVSLRPAHRRGKAGTTATTRKPGDLPATPKRSSDGGSSGGSRLQQTGGLNAIRA